MFALNRDRQAKRWAVSVLDFRPQRVSIRGWLFSMPSRVVRAGLLLRAPFLVATFDLWRLALRRAS